jgi:nitrate reductase NapD
MNISSIIVKTRPEHLEDVKKELEKTGICEIHFDDARGIVIVTIEGENVEEEINKVRFLEALPNVISADMHMSYCEEELDEMKKEIIDSEGVASEINADKPIEEIDYFGSLKGKY